MWPLRLPQRLSLVEPHKKNGPVLLQNAAATPWSTHGPNGLVEPHEKARLVLLQNVAPTPLGTHEHSRVHFLILSPSLGSVVGPHKKNGTVLLQNVAPILLGTHEHSRVRFVIPSPRRKPHKSPTAPSRIKAGFCYVKSRGGTLFQDVAPAKKPNGLPQLLSLVEPHKKNGLVLLQNVAPTPWSTHGSRMV